MYKKTGTVLSLIIGLFIVSFTSINSEQTEQEHFSRRERQIHTTVLNDIISFHNYLKDSLFVEVNKQKADEKHIGQFFSKSRLLFKKFEWAAEYFSSDLTKRLNGPPVQEIENADLLDPSLARGVDPMGLQVMEQYIYPSYDITRRKELIDATQHLITNTDYLISYFSDHQFADWRILDAAKLEIFRIITLGITGFDNSLALNSMAEAGASLKSLQTVIGYYVKKNSQLTEDLNEATEYLCHHYNFDSFDRATFITHYANKISAGIAQLELDLPGRKIEYNRMLRQTAKTLFDSGAFNADAFSPGPEFHITNAKVVLGKKLFYDAALSGTGTRNCASCHVPDLAFTDGLSTPTDIHDTTKKLDRNVPTLINAALQSNYFYDMRALTLEDQVRDVISNKHEMDGSMDAVIKYVSANKSYQSLFAKAFTAKKDKSIDADQVTNALAAYIRSLVKLNSRFDEYMRGNENALSKPELKGFNLFMGKAKCATCHFEPLFNGVTPPKYIQSETEVLGVPTSQTDSTLDPDLGYYAVIGVDSYKYAFKIPTVRNINKTAPYMHNGIYQTLEQVMDFYNNAGGVGLGIHLPNQTLSQDSLKLSDTDKKDIIAFMESLESK